MVLPSAMKFFKGISALTAAPIPKVATTNAIAIMLKINKKKILNRVTIKRRSLFPVFRTGAASPAKFLADSFTSFPHSSTLVPILFFQVDALSVKFFFTPCNSSCTLCLMDSRLTVCPFISNFSDAVIALGTTIQRMM